MKKSKKTKRKKAYRKPIMKKSDKQTMKVSLKYISLIFLLAGFLSNENALIGVGIVALAAFFMVEK